MGSLMMWPRYCIALAGGWVLLSINQPALAISPFLDKWRAAYPDSKSSDINCQLCHISRSGDEPWNAYGRDIRNKFDSLDPETRTIEQAFALVEELNSDGDEPATTNAQEIAANTQPGWKAGRTNNAYSRDDFIVGVFDEPLTVNPFPVPLPSQDYPLELVDVATGFTSPVGGVIAPVPGLRDQMFVIDQVGIVWRVDLNSGDKEVYLDVASRLVPLGAFETGGYDERGLLGFVFHPNFSINGRVYIYTSEPNAGAPDFTTLSGGETANHQSVVAELVISNPAANAGGANVSSQRELLRFDQPQFNHNGGALIFDQENNLYIALGDGGGADDQGVGHGESGNGANPANPFGSILRVDPLGNNSSNGQYGIPANNPFLDDPDKLNEIYAYGFRNPWKLSIDSNGDLYAADVGQNDIEEVNRVEIGKHYGWRIKEGRFFFDPNGEFDGIITIVAPDTLPAADLISPLLEYDHDEGISVTGGYVYRGARNPSLRGKYIFGDFLKRIFIGDLNTGAITATNLKPDVFIYSLAMDKAGELYLMGSATTGTSGETGKLIKLKSTLPEDDAMCFPIVAKNGNATIICL